MPVSDKLGLVLSAGGSRAAYQVGVIRFCAERYPNFKPKIYTGVSAGSINAAFLAQGNDLNKASKDLYSLWENLQFENVVKSNFRSVFAFGTRVVYDLFFSKVTHKVLIKSILDASPLAATLLSGIRFWKIARSIRNGIVEGLAVSATNYSDGSTTIFFDSTEPIPPWRREKRAAIRTGIHLRHIMASCSIPILFEPVRIGDHFYGDGALRLSFPLSPAIKLGATRILAVGIRSSNPEQLKSKVSDHLSMGYVAGSVLNSIFLEHLEADYENLMRINNAIGAGSNIKKLAVVLVRPSRDLGAIARDHFAEVPYHLRQLIRASAANSAELGDLLSYLMFSPGYIKALLELGYHDAQKQQGEIEKTLIS